mgnify:FL=1
MIKAIIFDLGGVLIDWNPKYLYSQIFKEEAEMNHFLETICTGAWNEEQDGGRTLQQGTEFLVAKYPQHEENIRAYYGRWVEMLKGPIEGTVDIFKQLKDSGKYKLYALTNWSAETFPIAREKFDFLNWFDGVVVSGTEKMRKPDPKFFQILLDRYNLKADEVVFIDDNLRNVIAAREMGVESIHFISPDELENKLSDIGVS